MFRIAKSVAGQIPACVALRDKWRGLHYSNRMVGTPFGIWDKQTNHVISYSDIVPNLVMIGGQKCGTTSLAYYLNSHPEIHLSQPIKEPAFFIFDQWAQEYWQTRGRHFKSIRDLVRHGMLQGYCGQRLFLDASTHYTFADRGSRYDVPSKLKQAGAKLLYIIRNPFSRIISAYYHARLNEGVEGTLNERVMSDTSLLQTSLYFRQLSAYLAEIPGSDIHVIIFEEFVADPATQLNQIWEFLDLEPIGYPEEFEAFNTTKSEKTEKFSAEVFAHLLPTIQADAEELNNYLGRNVEWDLGEGTWCE